MKASQTDHFLSQPYVRFGLSALLILIFIVAFNVYTSAKIVANDLTDETLYTNALAKNDIYDRVYTELLADPALQDVTNSLLGNLNINTQTSESISDYTTSTLRLVLPPETIQSAIEGIIHELLAYFRGDVKRYEASLDLSSLATDENLADTIIVYAQALTTDLLATWYDETIATVDPTTPEEGQIAAFAKELEQFAYILDSGDITALPNFDVFIDINKVPITDRHIFSDALLKPVEGKVPETVRLQVQSDIAAGNLAGAISIVSALILRPRIEEAVAELQAELQTGDLQGVTALAELAEEEERQIVSSLNGVRDFIVFLREGFVLPLAGALMILSLAGLGWIHADRLRRAMRIIGCTTLFSGAMVSIIWFVVIVLVANPFAFFTSFDVTSLPSSIQHMMNDVLLSIMEGIWSSMWQHTALAFWAGLALVALTFLPAATGRALKVVVRTKDVLERYTNIDFDRPRNAAAALIAIFVLVPLAVDTFITRDKSASAAERVCNGHIELCDRPLNEVALAATHNSMSSSELGWVWPTHDGGISEQLAFGIRGFLIDTHYWDTETQIRTFVQEAPEDLKPTIEELLVEERQILRELSKDGTFTCHGLCLLGATPFVDLLTEFRIFLEANPNEVIVIIIQDAISPSDTKAAFQDAGLLDYVYVPIDGTDWPTLNQMIDRNQRLVVMAEEAGEPSDPTSPNWYLHAWDFVQENPYTILNLDDFSCAPNRGATDNALFLLNHWIDRVSPSRVDAARTNAYDFLLNQAQKCQAERGLMPNLVAVNFYSVGDVIQVVDVLNGLESASVP